MASTSGLFGRYPVVICSIAALMLVAFVGLHLGADDDRAGETAIQKARTFYEQNPEVRVSYRDRMLLGPGHVDVIATAYAKEQRDGDAPVFSDRMRQRTQQRFVKLTDVAFAARLKALPAWRYGISDAGTAPLNWFAHVFIHESALALVVSLTIVLITGIALESAWGAALLAGFCLLGTLLPAVAFRLFDASGGVPLSGASGLAAMLLGAYLVRGFGGHFPVPGVLLLPVWAFVEFLFVRGVWIESLGSAPFVSHALALATGAGFAFGMRVLGIEKKMLGWVDEEEGPLRNPALDLAERASELGNLAEAVHILRHAQAESPRDQELALAWWNLARENGRGSEAVGAILPILRDLVRRGESARAIQHWGELVASVHEFEVEPTLSIRMGEGLLDEGHPEAALDALRRAVDSSRGLSTALAQRVVRIARDLDPGLTERAAAVALQDVQLDEATRASLEVLAAEVHAAPAKVPQRAASSSGTSPRARVAAKSTTTETTDYPIESDLDLHNTADLTDPDEFAELNLGVAPDGRGVETDAESIDPNSLSLQSLERQFAGDLGLDDGEELSAPDPLDALAADPQAEAPALFDRAGLSESYLDNSHLEAGALSSEALSSDAALEQQEPPAPEPPRAAPIATPAPAPAAAPKAPEPAPIVPPAIAPAAAVQAAKRAAPTPAPGDDLDLPLEIGGGLRRLKIVSGVPVGIKETALEIEVEGRGASKVPFDRIDAIAVAAVGGLSARPVLVIDLVLNWMSSDAGSLKVIRLHSNRFNPLRLEPSAASPLAALKSLVARILDESGATPLPGAAAVAGEPFVSFGEIAQYQREVLNAES